MFYTRTLFIAFLGIFWIFSGNGLLAQNSWETLPVFHNGRVMPLHTFARQVVREICGTERPYLVRDDFVIDDFSQVIAALEKQDRPADAEQEEDSIGYRFLIPGSSFDGGFDRRYSIFKIAGEVQQISTTLPIQGLDRAQIERLANRVRQIVPIEGRYFSADELLFSWICEPDVWRYIPIFLVSESEYLDEIFNTSFAGDARTSQYRVSLYQLEKSQRYKQRLTEIQRRHELGQIMRNPVLFDQITERLEEQSQLFLNLTFHPQRQRPTRMVALLSQTIGDQSSYGSALFAWGHLLGLGEIPGRQATERSMNPDDLTFYHPTTQRWHDIADKLLFLVRIYDRTDTAGNPVLPNAVIVEQQYEILIDLIDSNVAEAAAIMEALYPGVSYSSNNYGHTVNVERLLPRLMSSENQHNLSVIRQDAIGYYFSTRKLRKEIEAAYLALYDNGRSLRFLPLLSPLVMEMGNVQNNSGVLPWASAQMILGSGDAFIKRFLDSHDSSVKGLPKKNDILEQDSNLVSDDPDDFKEEASPETPSVVGAMSTSALDSLLDDSLIYSEDQTLLERALFQPVTMRDGNIRLGPGDQRYIGTIRTRVRELLFAYSSPTGGKYGSTDFLIRAGQTHLAVSQAAIRIESQRKLFVDPENRQLGELFKKTAYPDLASTKKILSEYRYNRLRPFFWMGFFALLAAFLNGGAYITAVARDKSFVARTVSIHTTAQGKTNETELADYTNSIEEWLFISSVVMLVLAILIAIYGGMVRAGITGWAPVTNMYETVVMMALAAAILGVWYALHPLLHPALRQAWDYSRFLRIGTILRWFSAVKTKKRVVSSLEGSGEMAMRAAAQEFGIPSGMTFGRHSPLPQLDSEDLESQQRVSITQRKLIMQCILTLPRLFLTYISFYLIVSLANGEYVAEHGFVEASVNMFAACDMLDSLTVIASVLLIIWLVPHGILALLLTPVVLFHPKWIAAELGIRSYKAKVSVDSAEQNREKTRTAVRSHSEMSGILHGESPGISPMSKSTSGVAWLKQARNALLDRKLLIAITASVVFIASLIANLNRAEFNPDIKPIMAVLRNNFWLTVHVSAIIVSYAAAFIAWGMAAVSLGYASFGRYPRSEPESEGERGQVLLPEICLMFSPIIERLIKISLLLLVAGTALGARWADFSWGRFWGWDPKEVWALITIIFLVIIFHGRIARYYGAFGITVGALFASIAVVFTWYGINFLPIFKNSVHAYGGGTEIYAMLFVSAFIVANLLWGTLALLRYNVEVHGNES